MTTPSGQQTRQRSRRTKRRSQNQPHGEELRTAASRVTEGDIFGARKNNARGLPLITREKIVGNHCYYSYRIATLGGNVRSVKWTYCENHAVLIFTPRVDVVYHYVPKSNNRFDWILLYKRLSYVGTRVVPDKSTNEACCGRAMIAPTVCITPILLTLCSLDCSTGHLYQHLIHTGQNNNNNKQNVFL